MTGPSPMGITSGPTVTNGPSQSAPSTSLSGHWSGMFADAGQNSTAEWTMTHSGSQLMGPGMWSDFHGHHDAGTFSGTMMSDTHMSFMWEIPWGMGGPMMSACTLTINGEGQVIMGAAGPTTVTGTYSSTNSCTGPIPDGQFTLNRDQ